MLVCFEAEGPRVKTWKKKEREGKERVSQSQKEKERQGESVVQCTCGKSDPHRRNSTTCTGSTVFWLVRMRTNSSLLAGRVLQACTVSVGMGV
jgi:hypothetical protein